MAGIDWTQDEGKTKRKGKDSIFIDLFHQPKYAAELVQSLHPEQEVTEGDITFVSLRSILMVRPYNDLGILFKGKLLICTEAQSTWSLNVLVRMFMYLAETYHRYIQHHTEMNLYGSKKVILPIPECYVIYTGNDRNCPEELSLANEFFGKAAALDLKAKVLTTAGTDNIIQQYVRFCHVFDEQVRLYGRTKQTVEKTIRICKAENILTDYLVERKKEVEDIMSMLFSQEEVTKRYGYECREEGREEGRDEGRKESILKSVRALMKKRGWDMNEAMDALDVSPEDRVIISAQL
ncbi:MAG: hypothetical protein IKR28_01940 [Selenomonadaceae bacterium]|nr:hypothetical protein [Selenomonadaceae bacterium]